MCQSDSSSGPLIQMLHFQSAVHQMVFLRSSLFNEDFQSKGQYTIMEVELIGTRRKQHI
jgi:hypothetical protein